MDDPLAGIIAELRFTPATYEVELYSGRVWISTNRDQPSSERRWRFPAVAEHRAVSIATDDRNVVWNIHFGQASTDDSGVREPGGDAPSIPEEGLRVGVPLDAAPTNRMTEDADGWRMEFAFATEPSSWWTLSSSSWIGVDANGQLASIIARGAAVPKQLELRISPDLDFRGRIHVDGERLHLDAVRRGDADEVDHEAEMADYQLREDAAVADWIHSDAPKPATLDHHESVSACDRTTSVTTADGTCTVRANEGSLSSIEAEPDRGSVSLPTNATLLTSPATWVVDTSLGATCTYDDSAGVDRARLDFGSGEPTEWFRVGEIVCGVSDNQLISIGFHSLERDDWVHQENDQDPPGIEEHLGFMRSLDWESVSTEPAYTTVGIADWVGPIAGGPHPGNSHEDRYNREITLMYGSHEDPKAQMIEIESRPHADPFDSGDHADYDQDAMWLAHHTASESLRSAESQTEAERAFREIENRGRELSKLPWAAGELVVGGVAVPARVRHTEGAWVAKARIDGSFVTVRACECEPSDLKLTVIDDLTPFITASRALHEQHLAMMEAHSGAEANTPSTDDRALRKATEQAFNYLPDPRMTDIIAPSVLESRGGADAYRRALSVYQSTHFANFGGGYGGSPEYSPDGDRAITTMHVDLPGNSHRGHTIMMSRITVMDDSEVPERPPLSEPSDDDVTIEDGRMNFQLRWMRAGDGWRLETDLLAHFERLLGSLTNVIQPA